MTIQQASDKPQAPRSDYRDLCITEAVEQIADLEHAVIVYREIATESIHALHRAHLALTKERQQRLALVDEFREFRRRVMFGKHLQAATTATSTRREKTRSRPAPPSSLGTSASEPPRPQA